MLKIKASDQSGFCNEFTVEKDH